MNLAQMFNIVYNDIGVSDTNRFTKDFLKDCIDEAQRRIVKATKCIRTEGRITAVANQRLYDFPSDILDFQIDKVFYAYSSDTSDLTELVKADLRRISEYDTLFYTTKGDPQWYFPDFENVKWGLYPFPLTLVGSGANKILMKYRSKHTKMTRYYTTGTITVSNGGTTVTGSGTVFSTNLAAGDKIGLGKLLDITRTYEFPAKFYTINTITDNTHLELTEAFAETTVSSNGYYIACADSTITNDEINQACCDYVIGKCLIKDKERSLGENYKDLAIQRAIIEQNSFENTGGKMQIQVPRGKMKPQATYGLHDYGAR